MKRMLLLLILLLAFAAVSACVPKKTSQDSPEGQQTPAGDPFALAISGMAPETTAVMNSPYGENSQVYVGYNYRSGLGAPCKRVDVLAGGLRHRLAVCMDRNNTWYVAEPIFEPSQR
ncbi:MAG: hypothetical protein PUB69_02230 [Desulfovibrionaceae bacterium]|nr:hypothetical protein [Desulfovibrionaceae bacterium]